MSYADPQSITVSGSTVSLPRTGAGETSGSFTSSDGLYRLDVSHAYGRRNRHNIRLTATKTTSDPLVPSQNAVVSMSCYMVVDVPKNGYSTAEAKTVVDALVALLTAGSGSKVTQLLGGES